MGSNGNVVWDAENGWNDGPRATVGVDTTGRITTEVSGGHAVSNVRITVTDEQGTLLAMETMSREEFRAAQSSAVGAVALLSSLEIGSDEN